MKMMTMRTGTMNMRDIGSYHLKKIKKIKPFFFPVYRPK